MNDHPQSEYQAEVSNDDRARHMCEHETCMNILKSDQEIRVGLCDKHLAEALGGL